jgi:hypothetical protein
MVVCAKRGLREPASAPRGGGKTRSLSRFEQILRNWAAERSVAYASCSEAEP